MRNCTLSILLLLLFCQNIRSQTISIDTSKTADDLIDKIFLGSGVRVGNVKVKGAKQSIGFFSMDTNLIGIKSGILLSTGNVFDIAKPNTSPKTSGISWDYAKDKHYRSDKDLNRICKGRTFDQCILEFDFVPFNNCVSFKFLFASEEYPEFVGSKFNDVFAFIITGPDLKKKNLATIPGTQEPITINTINQKKHKDLFINNDYFFNYSSGKPGNSQMNIFKKTLYKLFGTKNINGYYIIPREKKKLNQLIVSNFEYDGFTKVLKAKCILKPWFLYHLKIAIGDVGDAIYDSGVFLESNSFRSDKDSLALGFTPYSDLSNKLNWDSLFNNSNQSQNSENRIDEIFEITNINFAFDHYEIPDSSKNKLNMLASYLKQNPNFKLVLTGYTDSLGSKRYNQSLSEKRSIEVMNYLGSKGITFERMTYIGNNFENPIANNGSEIGRAINRRVELTIIDDE